MSHLPTYYWHLYSGDPLAFTIPVESTSSAADVVEAEWRHPDVTTLTLSGGTLSVSDDGNGNIVVDGDAGAPNLPVTKGKEAQLLVDVGKGLQVDSVQEVSVGSRVAA